MRKPGELRSGFEDPAFVLFPTEGEVAKLCRDLEWTSTPLGPIEDWPESLKAVAGLVIASPFPMILLWGPELVQIYNDGYRHVMGAKHPAGLGQPTRECWPEVWEFNAPIYDKVMNRAESFTLEDRRLVVERDGYPEEAFFDLAFSPVPDGNGKVGGVLLSVFETTEEMRARRAAETARKETKLANRARAHTEEHLRRVVEQAPVLIAILEGPSHRFTLANPRYRTVAGRPDILGQTIRDAFPELSDQGIIERLDEVYVTGKPLQVSELPIRIRLRPGRRLEERSFDFIYQPLRDERNEVYGVLVLGVDVSDKVGSRRALEESSARLNAVVDALPVGLVIVDRSGRITYTNPELDDILGAAAPAPGDGAGSFIGWTAFHPDGRSLEVDEFPLVRALRTAERVHPEEYLFGTAGGDRVWLSIGSAPILDSQRAVIGGIVTVQRIDEQKGAEEALRESEGRFRAIADLVPDLLWRDDASGKTSWYNQQWLEYTGQGLEDAIAAGWQGMIHPEDRARSLAKFDASLRSGEPLRHEHRIRRADGVYHWFLVQVRPVQDDLGRIAHWFGAATDVHDQRMALEAAERAEAHTREALELEQNARAQAERLQRLSNALASAVTPEEVARVTVAEALSQLGSHLGVFATHSGAERNASVLAHYGLSEEAQNAFGPMPIDAPFVVSEVIRTGRPVWIESNEAFIERYPHVRNIPEGTTTQSLAALPIVIGSVVHGAIALGFPEERTFDPEVRVNLEAIASLAGPALDRALLFQAERSTRAEAERANRAKDEFLAVMSHELRTPLTGITGYAELLADEISGPLSEPQKQQVDRIRAGAWHLVSIIEEILTFSRTEAGKEEVRWEEADVARVTREVVEIVEPQARMQGLRVRLNAEDAPLSMWTDSGKVRQILINLIGNGIKYTEVGEVTVTVDRSDPNWLRVHIRDTGPGIATADQERIFEPFTQLDSSYTRTRPGTGLGLAICRRLARLLAGDVTLLSMPGKGSTFTLTLPRQRPEEA
ncbi:MAG: PAS domain-containing protein [Gemmatimonas sp.]|nr:PAS domain-containing protein [Gemmatimonas sp.]